MKWSNTNMSFLNLCSVVGLAFVLWSSVVAVGAYVAEQPLREHGHEIPAESASEHGTQQDQLAGSIVELRKQVEAQPDSSAAKTRLGYALLLHGVETGSGATMIEALSLFDSSLKIDPNDEEALLGIASVSLRVGVLDKAVEHYQRYLQLQPNDVRALSDYALALQRLDRPEEAQRALDSALALEPDSVPVLMVYALLERERDRVAESRRFAERARLAAEDERSRASIASFIAGLESPTSLADAADTPVVDTPVTDTPVAAAKAHEPGTTSAAKLGSTNSATSASGLLRFAGEFFGNHPIVGPKFRGLSLEARILRVEVADFPVEHMPEVAKQRFSSRISEAFQKFNASLEHVDILEQSSKRRLMRISLPAAG